MKKANPVVWFEIPVNDMDRAIECYNNLFGYEFTQMKLGDDDMAFFPSDQNDSGISGALAKGDIYKPTNDGVLIYFKCDDIQEFLKKVETYNLEILFPFTSIGEYGYCAEFQDSEGNRIGLYQNPDK